MQLPENHEFLLGLAPETPGRSGERVSGERVSESEQSQDPHALDTYRIPRRRKHHEVLYTPSAQPWAQTLGVLTIGLVLGLIALTVILYFMY